MQVLIGEIAALGTACCWTFTSVFFTIGGSRVGSAVVNRVRLAMAVVFLSLTHLALFGRPYPVHAGLHQWLWLGLSGIIGLALGDAMLFQSFVMIGTRLAMLLMSLVPVIGALFAWALLGERLSAAQVAGMALTLGGIMWVIADKNKDPLAARGKPLAWGVALGIGGAMGQAFGLIASKKGMEGGFPALSANLIRMIVAGTVMWSVSLLLGRAAATLRKLKDGKAARAILGGAVFGPFVGVWLSLAAIDRAPIGIASTLMALPPVLLIPVVRAVFQERTTLHAVLGTLVAVSGVAVLFLA